MQNLKHGPIVLAACRTQAALGICAASVRSCAFGCAELHVSPIPLCCPTLAYRVPTKENLVPTIDDGLDIDNLDATSQEEIDTYLTRMWRFRGSLYEVSANSVWLNNPCRLCQAASLGRRAVRSP